MSAGTITVILVAVFAGSLLKSISGFGLPLVAVPTISLVADIETAVAVLALPNLAINLVMAWRGRGHYGETRDLPVLAITGFVGGVIGTIALVSLPEEPLVAALVLVVIGYVVRFYRAPDVALDPTTTRRWAAPVGTVAGALQGAIGISGPVVVSWVHAYRLSRAANVFAVTALFSVAGLAQVPTLATSGELDGRWLVTLAACAPALAPIPVGERLRDRFSSQGFDRFVITVLSVAVLGLAIRTFS